MIGRVLNFYYPRRTLVLLGAEAAIICSSFLMAILLRFGHDSLLVLHYENGFYKILAVTVAGLLCGYYLDVYNLQHLDSRGDVYFRLLVVVGSLAFVLAGISYAFPQFAVGNHVFLIGLCILTLALLVWRVAFGWLLRQPYFRERVYVVGNGERARQVVSMIRTRDELGMEVVGWAGAMGNGSLTQEELGKRLLAAAKTGRIDRIIVALADRRSTMPITELLHLRMADIKVEEATQLWERINGKIEVDELSPSCLIFSEGFRLSHAYDIARRVVSLVLAFLLLLAVLPFMPLLILLVKYSSPGPALYNQKRMGRDGRVFTCYKFRTMRVDAEAETGPTWASDNDPRITRIGRWMRRLRLDEIPQLWNILKGDMSFVGPRPERPEFFEYLQGKIPFYHLRCVVSPGLTGWAQINYGYGASVEESKEKLRYDLYYIKNGSLALDLLIVFQTIKTVFFGRGAR